MSKGLQRSEHGAIVDGMQREVSSGWEGGFVTSQNLSGMDVLLEQAGSCPVLRESQTKPDRKGFSKKENVLQS